MNINTRVIYSNLLRKETISLLNTVADGYYYLNGEWEFIVIGNSPELPAKKEGLIFKNIWDVLPKYQGTLLDSEYHRAFREQTSLSLEVRGEYSGKWFRVFVYPEKQGILVIFINLSQSMELQKENELLDRINIVGKMAAAVLHEIRNPMTVINGYLQLLGQKEASAASKRKYSIMIDELDRVNQMISGFLSLCKKKSHSPEPCNLGFIIKDLLPLLDACAVKDSKRIVVDMQEMPDVMIDENEMRQVLLNLVNNGLDAVQKGGTVKISTWEEDSQVVLAIEDNGGGIDPLVVDRIWEPYVTTKAEGSGLGLPISNSLVRRNNAALDFTTGHLGTTFYIRFPCAANTL